MTTLLTGFQYCIPSVAPGQDLNTSHSVQNSNEPSPQNVLHLVSRMGSRERRCFKCRARGILTFPLMLLPDTHYHNGSLQFRKGFFLLLVITQMYLGVWFAQSSFCETMSECHSSWSNLCFVITCEMWLWTVTASCERLKYSMALYQLRTVAKISGSQFYPWLLGVPELKHLIQHVNLNNNNTYRILTI